MEILYLLIPLAVIFLVIAVGFFLWTIRSGQYDDMEGPAYRILMDDDDPMVPGRRPRPEDVGKAEASARVDSERDQGHRKGTEEPDGRP